MVPVLNLSLMVHLSQHGGVSLQHVRRLTDLLHQSMSDPRLLDAYEGGKWEGGVWEGGCILWKFHLRGAK